MTEYELFDEYMRLCGLQESCNDSRGFLPTDSVCDTVYHLMGKMREIGLEENKTVGTYFENWFFKCHGRIKGLENEPDAIQYRVFSICVYVNGWMELRWG